MLDANNDGQEYLWGADDWQRSTGGYAAWPARAGANGQDPASHPYPPNMKSWMIYGPFDLSNAESASAVFQLQQEVEWFFDYTFVGVSDTPDCFQGFRWDENTDGWTSKSLDLQEFIGDAQVWIAWYFQSDANNSGGKEFPGPWIDDISLQFEPGDVTVSGRIAYADRFNRMMPAIGSKIQLMEKDWDSSDDILSEAVVQPDGTYSFLPVKNWDEDDYDPSLSNRRLDLYVRWSTTNADFLVTDLNLLSENPYSWDSPSFINVLMGTKIISDETPSGGQNLPAMWIFQDLRRAREYYIGSDPSDRVDPGFLDAHWQMGVESEDLIGSSHFWAYGDPHVFISDTGSPESTDTVVHEVGHHMMYNLTNWWWINPDCWYHDIFSQELTPCAWSEGWGDFFAIMVNNDNGNDECYDKRIGPCTGRVDIDYYNLETHGRGDGKAEGDGVEGRVAGALYDMIDTDNEGYDIGSWDFDPLARHVMLITSWAYILNANPDFHYFWENYPGDDKHFMVSSIFQNNIDYDYPPVFYTPLPPFQYIFKNHSSNHILDLNQYVGDPESPNDLLTYQLYQNPGDCNAVIVDNHWVGANPAIGWSGSCEIIVEVLDSLGKFDMDSFYLVVDEPVSTIFLPAIRKD